MSIVYVIFLVLAVIFSFKYDKVEENNKHKNHCLWLLCLMLIFISGMSFGLGGDKFTYMREFDNYPTDISQLGQQITLCFLFRSQMPGWVTINMLCKWLFDSFYAVQFIEAICINLSVCYFIKQYTHRYFTFLLLYFVSFTYFTFNTEIMREAISLSFVLFAYSAYLRGHKILYVILCGFGLLFHLSAAIALLFPFARIKYAPYMFFVVWGTSFFLWAGSDFFMTTVLRRLGGTGNVIQKVFFYSTQASTFFGFLRSSITYIVFPFITMYYAVKWESDDVRKKAKIKFYSFQLSIAIIASAFVGLTRLHNYAEIIYLLMIADFIYLLFKKKSDHQGLRLFTTMGIFVFIVWQYAAYWPKTGMYNFELWYPYTTVNSTYQEIQYRELGHAEVVNPDKDDKNQRDVNY